MNSQEKRRIRRAMSRPLSRLTSSVNPDRIKTIQCRMTTPNYTHEGMGRQSYVDRLSVNTPTGQVPMDVYRITKTTTKHGKGPTGFYRGIYR